MTCKKKSKIIEYLLYAIIGLFIILGSFYVIYKIITDSKPIEIQNNTSSGTTSAEAPITEDETTANPDRESNALTIPDNAYFATEDVNIRDKSSTSGKKYGLLHKYNWVIVDSKENGWYKIKYDDSPTGYAYIFAEYLSNDKAFREEAIAYLQEMEDDKLATSNIVDKTNALYTYDNMVTDLNELSTKYPDFLHISTIGTTIDGRDIYLAKLGNENAPKQILVHGNIHAREYMTTLLIMSQIEYYLDNYNYWYDKANNTTYKDLFNNICIYYIPTINPDGMTIAQFGLDGLLTANAKEKVHAMLGDGDYTQWKSNVNGVDLNKQFPYGFNSNKISNTPGYQNYAGESSLSENESKALYDLVKSMPDVICSIAYHSTGEDIYWNSNASGDIQEKCKNISDVIAKVTGYNKDHDFEYYNGYDTDWLVKEEGIPAFTVEVGSTTCPLPISEFYNIWKDNKKLIAAIAMYLK